MMGLSSFRRTVFLFTSSLAIAIGGCDQVARETNSPEPETQATDLTVVTTILPITQFTNAVVGDRAKVIPLLPTNVDPHDFQAQPSDVKTLADADVLVKNGLEMEFFLDGLIANAGNTNLAVIDSSQGVEVIRNEEDHSHDHPYHHDHNQAEHHDHGEYNPHIWLDPKRAIQQVQNIRDSMIALDPEGEAIYAANAATFIAELEALDSEITNRLGPFKGKTFVTFHDFAPYFAQSYGLETQFLVDVPAEKPSPNDVKRVINAVQKSSLKTLLAEPSAGEDSFAAIAKDTGVKVSLFDPIEMGPPEAIKPNYYLDTMVSNVDNLVSSFGASTQSMVLLRPWATVEVMTQRVAVRL